MQNLEPLFDRVVLQPRTETRTESGLYVPAETSERSQTMQVIATGKDCVSVKVGDDIVVHRYAGTEFVGVGGKKLFIVKEIEILGRLI